MEQKHIDQGLPHKCRNCPLALALNEATRDQYEWAVGVESIYQYRKDDDNLLAVGHNTQLGMDFIKAFDNGDKINAKPFECYVVMESLL